MEGGAMACTSVAGGLPHRSSASSELRSLGMRRSRSEPQLRNSLTVPRAAAPPSRLSSSRSTGMFPFQFSGTILPTSIRSLLFDPEDLVDSDAEGPPAEEGIGAEKRANWVERILELRGRWRDRHHNKDGSGDGDENNVAVDMDYVCNVGYENEDEYEEEKVGEEWDRESFSRFLNKVSLADTKLFSQLAFLCNLAYVIPDIKAGDLHRYYNLRLVTSSLERKSGVATVCAKLDTDSTRPPPPISGDPDRPCPGPGATGYERKRRVRPSIAYQIAASAASYVHSRTKDLLSLAAEPSPAPSDAGRVYKPEVAAYVTASTMTAVVAAEEDVRLETARDLRSLQTSPCEWFVCDEPDTCTRCFVIQGSDSLSSWQANLLFEPTKFEGTDVLVHRGIYEAAKGIYEQFMPEIQAHLQQHGYRARLRFTGHSLGGSLSVLVSLMLMARGAVPHTAVLPVVTFGSPSVFCGGHRILDELGLDDGHVRSVMMHRDIVPRAFSCNYPNHVAQVLKRLNSSFRSHPCLNNDKLLYSPLGQMYILQSDEKSSPPHPLLPQGAALYAMDKKGSSSSSSSALRAFLNMPHPLETLSDPSAYGSEGTILRDHDSSNYLKAVNGLLRSYTRSAVRLSRRQQLHEWWPLLTPPIGSETWGHHQSALEKQALTAKEVATGV